MQATFKKYRLQFNEPVNYFGTMIEKRNGIQIEISHNGLLARADIPINLEFMTKNIDRNIIEIVNGLPRVEFESEIRNLFLSTNTFKIDANYKFGVNSALLDLYLQMREEIPDYKSFLSYKYYQNISSISTEIAEKMLKYGEISPKIKYSCTESELDQIHTLHSKYGIKFRIDLNRKLDFKQAKVELERINPEAIEYIEEPCSDISKIAELKSLFRIPIAIDETIINNENSNNIMQIADCYIIKPALIGDFNRIFEIANYANANNKPVVISSTYENSVGIKALKNLISVLDLNDKFMGLDTEKYINSIEYSEVEN